MYLHDVTQQTTNNISYFSNKHVETCYLYTTCHDTLWKCKGILCCCTQFPKLITGVCRENWVCVEGLNVECRWTKNSIRICKIGLNGIKLNIAWLHLWNFQRFLSQILMKKEILTHFATLTLSKSNNLTNSSFVKKKLFP